MKNLALPLVLFVLSLPAVGGSYKWTDDDGNTVYSQIPPNDDRRVTRTDAPPPPAENPQDAQRELQQLQQRLEDAREDRQLQAEKQREATQQDSVREQNCRKARTNLRSLREKARQLINTGDGQYRRYTPEERADMEARYQEVIERNCR